MSLFEERVGHAVTYLHNHRADLTSDFQEFYGNHDCESLIERSKDAFTRVGEHILNSDPTEWTFELFESLSSPSSELNNGSPVASYMLVFRGRDGSFSIYIGITHVSVGRRYAYPS
jgi:hypothetical protein